MTPSEINKWVHRDMKFVPDFYFECCSTFATYRGEQMSQILEAIYLAGIKAGLQRAVCDINRANQEQIQAILAGAKLEPETVHAEYVKPEPKSIYTGRTEAEINRSTVSTKSL